MEKDIKKINDILVNLYNMVLKLEEEAIREASDGNLSITEIHTLVAIGRGRPKTMTHVANLLGVSVSTLTSAINKLVKKGYVERVRDDADRRIVKIHLTEQGGDTVAAHEEFHRQMIGEAISEIPPEGLQRFIASIDNINHFLIMRSSAVHGRPEESMMDSLKLGSHTLPIPIVQAGMSIGVGGSTLAGAVAAEGGLGLIGTSAIGWRSEGYEKNPVAADLKTLEEEVALARKKAKSGKGKGLIGVSIMWNSADAYKYAETAIKAGAQVIVTSAGIPTDLPKYCNSKKVALLPTISSKRAASVIIRTWSQKYNRVPDGFIFQGPLAAGMLGFKEAELEKAEKERYRIIADIKAELSKLENCPLIVGGGITSKEDARKVYRCGADGFLMGSRFVATEECDAPEEFKKLYLNCTANDVTIIRSPMKTSLRVMENAFTEQMTEQNSGDYDLIRAVMRSAGGDFANGAVFCGAGVDKIKTIVKVKDVFREFTT